MSPGTDNTDASLPGRQEPAAGDMPGSLPGTTPSRRRTDVALRYVIDSGTVPYPYDFDDWDVRAVRNDSVACGRAARRIGEPAGVDRTLAHPFPDWKSRLAEAMHAYPKLGKYQALEGLKADRLRLDEWRVAHADLSVAEVVDLPRIPCSRATHFD
jgi:hypothetical protein